MQNKIINFCVLLTAFYSLSLSAQVRMSDLIAWNRIHQEALDLHPVWSKVYLIKTFQKDGSEKRIYVNRLQEKLFKGCLHQGSIKIECQKNNICLKDIGNILSESQMETYLLCSEKQFGCDNIFIIKDKMVISYLPIGSCFTAGSHRPDPKYKPLSDKLEIVTPNGF